MASSNFDNMRRRWLRTVLAAGAAASGLAAGGVQAQPQDWPTRPVRLILGFAAGSSGDLLARMIAPRLEALWKQPVIVENKPGAGSVIATEYVAFSNDNHVFLVGSLSSLLPKYTTRNLRYDPVTDLVPVYRLIDYEFVIVTNAKTAERAGTLQEMKRLGQSTQGVFFAGTGPASIFNLSMAVVNRSLGIRYATIDHNNVPAMTMAVLRNDAQLMVNAPGAIRQYFDSGELRPLAVFGRERYPSMPDVPTVYEAGYKGDFLPLSWHSLFAPKAMPAAIVERVGSDLRTVLSDAELRKSIETRLTGTVPASSPAQFRKEYLEDAKAWQAAFIALDYKPE
ncbi:tripartite tricarboxylate transporter substrate binding protein [Pseudorhodoferax sp.]|uniref:tripartite tricarboxylate transporter substrate binding protein n=1 Tax=Pseudorhodoferax sp. TaxID=1993553 RepID=UPI0039E31232